MELSTNAYKAWQVISNKFNQQPYVENAEGEEYWDDDKDLYVDVDEIDPANKARFV